MKKLPIFLVVLTVFSLFLPAVFGQFEQQNTQQYQGGFGQGPYGQPQAQPNNYGGMPGQSFGFGGPGFGLFDQVNANDITGDVTTLITLKATNILLSAFPQGRNVFSEACQTEESKQALVNRIMENYTSNLPALRELCDNFQSRADNFNDKICSPNISQFPVPREIKTAAEKAGVQVSFSMTSSDIKKLCEITVQEETEKFNGFAQKRFQQEAQRFLNDCEQRKKFESMRQQQEEQFRKQMEERINQQQPWQPGPQQGPYQQGPYQQGTQQWPMNQQQPQGSYCGDGKCNEDPWTCREDCGQQPPQNQPFNPPMEPFQPMQPQEQQPYMPSQEQQYVPPAEPQQTPPAESPPAPEPQPTEGGLLGEKQLPYFNLLNGLFGIQAQEEQPQQNYYNETTESAPPSDLFLPEPMPLEQKKEFDPLGQGPSQQPFNGTPFPQQNGFGQQPAQPMFGGGIQMPFGNQQGCPQGEYPDPNNQGNCLRPENNGFGQGPQQAAGGQGFGPMMGPMFSDEDCSLSEDALVQKLVEENSGELSAQIENSNAKCDQMAVMMSEQLAQMDIQRQLNEETCKMQVKRKASALAEAASACNESIEGTSAGELITETVGAKCDILKFREQQITGLRNSFKAAVGIYKTAEETGSVAMESTALTLVKDAEKFEQEKRKQDIFSTLFGNQEHGKMAQETAQKFQERISELQDLKKTINDSEKSRAIDEQIAQLQIEIDKVNKRAEAYNAGILGVVGRITSD